MISKICGIDYSMNSPGLCVYSTEDRSKPITFQLCQSYFFTTKKKFAKDFGNNIHGVLQPEWGCPEQRFDQLSDLLMPIIEGATLCFLESYSYGSHGKIFEIAENTAILKYKLYKKSCPFNTISPMSVKKFATTKGNADKKMMIDVFCKTQDFDIRKIMGCGDVSPLADVVDSYFLLAAGISRLKTA